MLWVGAGAVGAGYDFWLTTKPFTGWVAPLSVQLPLPLEIALALVLITLLAALISVPFAGYIRLRGWRRGHWLRAAAWAGAWCAIVVLYVLSSRWAEYPEQNCMSYQYPTCRIPSPAVVSWGELPICAAFLVLGILMTWVLAVPPARRSDVASNSRQASVKASWTSPGRSR
jgi:hypothetical protein